MTGKGHELRSEGKERLQALLIVTRVIPDTLDTDKIVPQEKVVVFFDICSSSKILEDLHLSGNLKHYRDLLISVKEFLLQQEKQGICQIYKFIGDGWALLLPSSVKGEQLAELLYRVADLFHKQMDALRAKLSTTPDVLGLTYGVDKGTLIRLVMGNQPEYIGRPLNIAARLQGAVKDRTKEKDKNPAYKALISKPAFDALKIPRKYSVVRTSRNLRNIQGGEKYGCFELAVLNPTASSDISG